MALLLELKKQREAALSKSEAIITAAESGNRQFTDAENQDLKAANAEVDALTPQIAAIEKANTLRAQNPKGVIPSAKADNEATPEGGRRKFSREYRNSFAAYAASRGTVVSEALIEGADELGGYAFPARNSALYEGSNPAGGFAVPSQVDGEFVPLAPPEMGVYSLVNVVPTTMDTRYTRKDSHGTAAAKAESGATTNSFAGTDATIGQFTLSSYMMGHYEDASWELLQDVPQFQAFMEGDELLSLAVLRENWIINGTGAGQAQGLIGNVGTGTGNPVIAGTDGYGVELIDATLDVQGVLNAAYFNDNTRFLMQRSTSILIRKAQRQANLFEPVFVRAGGKDYLHGIEVAYSSAMPAVAAGNTPILLGDFKAGYLFGERGGSGVRVKILDQPKALQGLLTVLAYQRVDGRVRRTEAIQPVVLHS